MYGLCFINQYLSRMGSESPARVNSTRILGRVAENRRVCLVGGSLETTSFSCSPNPISNNLTEETKLTAYITKVQGWEFILGIFFNYFQISLNYTIVLYLTIHGSSWKEADLLKTVSNLNNKNVDWFLGVCAYLSASSNTTISMEFSFSSISTQTCINRPGVATMMSGLPCIASNWLSIESPPNTTAAFRPTNRPISRMNATVWNRDNRIFYYFLIVKQCVE